MLLPEDGPACWYLVPALDHEGVHAAGTVLGAGQQLPGPAHQSGAGLHQSEAGLHQSEAPLQLIKTMVMFYKQKRKGFFTNGNKIAFGTYSEAVLDQKTSRFQVLTNRKRLVCNIQLLKS